MDGLVEELLRLESAKHKALVSIDAVAYEASVCEQMRLVAGALERRGLVAAKLIPHAEGNQRRKGDDGRQHQTQ